MADPSAPPLIPAHEASRTRSFVRYEVDQERGILVYWRHDPRVRTSWGQILYFHSIGAVWGGKIRDVLGLAPRFAQQVKKELAAWWRANRDRTLRRFNIDPNVIGAGMPGRPETRKVLPFDARTIHRDGVLPSPFAVPVNVNLANATFMVGDRAVIDAMMRNPGFSGFRRDLGPESPGGFAGMAAPQRPPAQPAPQAARIVSRPEPKPRKVEPELPTYGPSQAVIVDYDEGLDREIARSLGRPITAQQAASIAGAPDDARVGMFASLNEVQITWTRGDGTIATRRIANNGDALTLLNDRFEVPQSQQGKGLGRQVFGRQVEQAREAGISQIATLAAGDPNTPDMVGYKVWPKLGYDGPLPDEIIRALPESLQGAAKISDLMLTEEGRAWWEANGRAIFLTFDLSEGSPSMETWQEYLKAKMRTRKRKQG